MKQKKSYAEFGDVCMTQENVYQNVEDFEKAQSKIEEQKIKLENEIDNLKQDLIKVREKSKKVRDKYIRDHFSNEHFFFEFLLDGENYEFAKKIVESINTKTCTTCEHQKHEPASLGEENLVWCDLYKSSDPPDAVDCEWYELNTLLSDLGYKG